MPKTRPPYPAEYREQIIELARAGRPLAELAREFGVSTQTLRNWLRPYRGEPAVAAAAPSPASTAPLSATEREELARLRRELKRVQMERDILAKATAWFAARNEKTSTPSSS